jgi:hypothetical protein
LYGAVRVESVTFSKNDLCEVERVPFITACPLIRRGLLSGVRRGGQTVYKEG